MSRASLHYIVQKFYFPLGVLALLLLFSLMLLHSSQEKENKLSLLVQEVEQLRYSLQDAALSLERDALQAVPAKVVQINSSLNKIEGALEPAQVSGRISTEWLAVARGWKQLQSGAELNKVADAAPSPPAKNQLGMSLGELRLRCDELATSLGNALAHTVLLAEVALWATIMLIAGLLAYIFFFVHKHLLAPLQALLQQLSDLKEQRQNTLLVGNGFLEPLQQQLQQQHELETYLAQAVEQIGDGNFQQDEAALRKAGVLGAAVLLVRQKMQLYFQADQRRAWSGQGLEKFNKLLREQNKGLESLCKELVSELVPFMNASQGAIFVAGEEEGEAVLQLQASYAWGRHKYLNKSIRYGEGLIGQVAQEKELMLITDVPANYITIGSGLGRAKPRCILILPLIINEEFQGALELASFRVFEAHELEFLGKLAETVASALASLKSATKTQSLLEKANAANAHLQAQEEELRQNTEELIATQEAMEKKDMELMGLFSSINYSLFTAEYDLAGSLLTANDKFKSFLGLKGKIVEHLSWTKYLQVPHWKASDEKHFMQALLKGEPQNIECRLLEQSGTWIAASFTPVLDAQGQVQKLMMLATDISQRKEAELAYVAQAEEITRQEEKLRHYTAELEVLQASLSDKLREAQQEMQQQIREIALEKEKNVAILEGCVDGVISFNENGTIEYFNKAAEEIWETNRFEVLGSDIGQLMSIEIHIEQREPQVYFSKGGLQKVLDIRTEVPLFGAGGEEMEALLTLTRVRVGSSFVFTAFVQKVAVELF